MRYNHLVTISRILISGLIGLLWGFIFRATHWWEWALCFLGAYPCLLLFGYIANKRPHWRLVNRAMSIRDAVGFLLYFAAVMFLGKFQYEVTGYWHTVLSLGFVLTIGFSYLYFPYICPGQYERIEQPPAER